jgi:hypothetical protein
MFSGNPFAIAIRFSQAPGVIEIEAAVMLSRLIMMS